MARIEIVSFTVTDDIDGTPLPEGHASTRFGFNGATFEIDLSEANAEDLAAKMAEIQARTKDLEEQITALRMEHNRKCAEMIRPFMANGRRVEIVTSTPPKGKAAKGRKAVAVVNQAAEAEKRRAMRSWAMSYIPSLSDRGRLHNDIVTAYNNGRDVEALRAYARDTQNTFREGGFSAPVQARPVSAPPAVTVTPEPTPEAPAETAPADKPATPAAKRKTPAKASA